MIRARQPARLVALVTAFLAFGSYWGAFTATTADLKGAYGLSAGAFGLVLASFPIAGAPVSILSGRLCRRLGARRVAVVTALMLGASGAILPFMPSAWLVPVAALAVGASSALYDVAINTQAVALETARGTRYVGRMHAMFFLGSVGGAAVAALVHLAGLDWRLATIASGVILALASSALALLAPEPADGEPTAAPHSMGLRAALRTPRVLRLAAVVCVGFSLESGINSWATVYLRDSLSVAAAVASATVAVLFTLNALGSASADPLGGRYGSWRVVALGGAGAGLAILVAVATLAPWIAFIGFAGASFSLALLAPTGFSESGRIPNADAATVIATLTAIGYASFLAGPLIMGSLAEALGLRGALAVLSLFGVAAAIVGAGLRPRVAQEPAG